MSFAKDAFNFADRTVDIMTVMRQQNESTFASLCSCLRTLGMSEDEIDDLAEDRLYITGQIKAMASEVERLLRSRSNKCA